MKHVRIIAVMAALGLALILAWGCQNAKPVGPMKYVTMNATVSTKGIVQPKAAGGIELLYRVFGPSMNPVSGIVTLGMPTADLKASVTSPSAASVVNFTVDVPAGPSRTLAVQINYMGDIYAITPGLTDPKRVMAIGAAQFDVDPGTAVVNVPLEVGPMCCDCCSWSTGDCFYLQGGDNRFHYVISVAYMGNTDLVNCAYVPDSDYFSSDSTCDAKWIRYNRNNQGVKGATAKALEINTNLEVGDVYCFTDEAGGHYWGQVMDEYGALIFRYNPTRSFYGFDSTYTCFGGCIN